MSGLGTVLAAWAEKWLAGFRRRHGLDGAVFSNLATDDRVLLHVACGNATIDHIPLPGFHNAPWRELRLDADASVQPDIVGTMTDMSVVSNDFADAIYSSHGIEHLYPHEVSLALKEFMRVLKPDGYLVLTCPDLKSVCRIVAEDKLDDTTYLSVAGPIAPIDILYGLRSAMAAGNLFMAHRCGFTLKTLLATLRAAGFSSQYGLSREGRLELWVLASKSNRSPDELKALASNFLPPAD
jgi:SAM-dependent methyltransferase